MQEDYQNVRRQIAQATSSGVDKETVLWTVVSSVASVIDNVTDLSIATTTTSSLQSLRSASSKTLLVANPWFVWNGHDQSNSAATEKYLRQRKQKQLGGTALALASGAASTVTVVNVGAVASHGNATGSSIAHIVKLKAIAKSYKQSATISEWIDLVLQMKMMKAGVRGGQLVLTIAGSVPYGGSAIVSTVGGLIAGGAKLGIKIRYTHVCLMTAADLHWRAFQEQTLLGNQAGTGPATRIICELLKRRGLTTVLGGQYDYKQIIKEPVGWMVISDKLLLL